MITKALLNRRLRQLHLWLGVAIGAQIGLWLISGLFMTWFPIEEVRGEHLRADAPPAIVEFSRITIGADQAVKAANLATVEVATLKIIADAPVWMLKNGDEITLVSAMSGEEILPLSQEKAVLLAQRFYSGRGTVLNSSNLIDPPQEYGRAGPVWKVDFGPIDRASFYIDAWSGDLKAVRTPLWRVFDFMWGLHIMDWSSRENFNSWWIKMTASLAVLFFLAGLGLVILRLIAVIRS